MSPGLTRNRPRGDAPIVVVVALAAALIGGCTTETKRVRAPTPPPPPRADAMASAPRDVLPSNAANLDPCAIRLHDVAGALLMYYFTHQRLPDTLDEVTPFGDAGEPVVLTCPASDQPYVYTAQGILLAEQRARVIVYDPTPAHYGGYRWAIRIEEPADGKPLLARVIALPESFFVMRPPG